MKKGIKMSGGFEDKASQAGPVMHMTRLGKPVWTPRNYTKLAKEAYVQNAIAYRCVKLIAAACADMPLFVIDENGKAFDTHPFLDLINNPNPFQSKKSLLRSIYSFVQLAGNSYLEGVILGKDVKELFSLRPDRMTAIMSPKGYPQGYKYTVGQNSTTYKIPEGSVQHPILHIKEFHPTDDVYGMSPVEAAAYAIDVHNEASTFNKSLLQNSATPSGALVYNPGKGPDGGIPRMTDDQFARVKKEMDDYYSGAKNAGRPLVLEGGLDWKDLGMTPKDLEFVEGKRSSAREIALSFGVPPMLLGIPGDNTYSNYAEANRAFYRQTVIPNVHWVLEEISRWLRPTYGDDFLLATDLDALEALSAERKDLWDRVGAASMLTADEKRKVVGYEAYEPGKTPGSILYGTLSDVPLGEDMDIVGGNSESRTEEEED